MKRRLTYGALFGLALAAAWFWLGQSRPPAPEIASVQFVPTGVKLRFSEPTRLLRLILKDGRGNLVADQRYSNVKREQMDLPLAWAPGSAYKIEAFSSGGRAAMAITSPVAERVSGLWVELLAPYDGLRQNDGGRAWGLAGTSSSVMPADGFTTCALVLKNHFDHPVKISGRIELPTGFLVDGAAKTAIAPDGAGQKVIRIAPRSLREQEVFCHTFRLKPPAVPEASIRAEVECLSGLKRLNYTRRIDLRPLSGAELASLISISQPRLPTGKDGFFDRRKQMDTIHYRPAFLRDLCLWLGLADGRLQYWLPFTYQSLLIKNNSGHHLGLVIKSRIESLHTHAVPKPFQPPNVFSGALRDDSVAVSLTLGPNARAKAVLPVFVTAPPVAGTYRRVIKLYPMGSQTAIADLKYPLYVKRLDLNALCFTALSGFLSLAAFAVFAFKFRSLLSNLKVRWLVVISLFGSLTFVGVNLPLRIFGSLIYGLLGPFSVVVLGFFNDLLYFTLLVAVVRLIPRPGVVSLITLVRYFLSIMLTGGFHLSDFFYVGSSLAVKEGAFWLAGVTRKGGKFRWNWLDTLQLALLLGLGDAFLNASSLYIHMVLFRLYFADWFIWLNVIVNGQIYTMIGVFLGRSFSRHLAWAEE